MAIGKISGPMLQTNLVRQGVDLAIDTNAVYVDVTNRRLGVNNSSPAYTLDVSGNVRVGNVYLLGNTISTDSGVLNLGSTSNIKITGGSLDYVLVTDGTGNVSWANVSTVVSATGLAGNIITLGSNTGGQLVSNATTLTTSTSVTNAVAQLNYVLGKLVPSAPPTFPNSTTLTVSSVTSYGRMCNFTQTDNTAGGRNVTGGTTLANVLRVSTYSTNTITNVGPGDSGTVAAVLNGATVGSVTLTGSSNGTYSNLIISSNQDYHNVSASVAAGFWYSFSVQASGNTIPGGYNSIQITDNAATNTNVATWYYDSSAPGTPTFSNTSITFTSNAVSYSSTIPHLNSNSQFKLKGNIAKLSGDMYYTSDTFMTGTAGGALQAPVSVTYSIAGVTTPLARNLYVSSGSAYFETTSNVVSTGFGSSSSAPSLTAYNSYSSASGSFAPGVTILYKNGTGTNIEETSIPVTSVGTGSGNGFRIVNPGSTDNPSFTGSEAAFNSQTSTLQTYDATNVGSGAQGVIKFDQTNYSTGYLPVGPNLTGQGSNQYFTFKFTRTTVSKFDILYTGTIAGLWVALPGSTIMTTASPTNGWLDMSTAYAGSGVPGTGSGGNGSAGCSTGGAAVLNSAQTNKSVTATFGTVQSGSSGTNTGDIYVRVKLTSGQSLTALSIVTATH